MNPSLLTVLIAVPAAIVVLAVFYLLWSERSSSRTAAVAAMAGLVLAAWMLFTSIAAIRGFYLPPQDTSKPPPVGIQLGIALTGLSLALACSPSLRSLLTNQRNLIRLNVWRIVGAVFLALMLTGQVPALWALPAGAGDVAIGATAFWVASRLDAPGGRRRAILFNWLGLLDLVVAVGLGITTSPGPVHIFHTRPPTSELMTRFPMVLVPAFLVPLACMVHIVSLWQLSGRPWLRPGSGGPP
jgi:hypothetical protein